ncbi:lysophospholipid acyltransferase family protein [Bailinhaonella thermotolerans]|uniref:lysophospholipid acyltransferase family protein n=1 Tax=Bailinhaonella thermotolerans TaxID=1070861 RepID=UPI001F5B1AD3|nr:lysophospholipid acyltransferase family protein [Bailinhaonella thermotolerans]
MPWEAFTVGILRPLLAIVVRHRWRGREHVPAHGGVIIAANHLSWSDPLFLSLFLYNSGRWPVFLAKSGIFEVPLLGPFLRQVKQIPVYRDRSDAALSLRDAEKGLREGAAVIVYPEGTCTRDPDLWPMAAKTGVARLAIKTGVPVIPVAHWGAQDVLPYGDKLPRLFPRKTFKVLAGPPVDLSAYRDRPLTASTLRAATEEVMKAITHQLSEIRHEKPPAEPYRPSADRDR